MERAPLLVPLSMMQSLVCDLLGLSRSYKEIAGDLSISEEMVREHTKRAARKIPGDLPAQMRCIVWARGATEDVLKGLTLRYEVELVARSARRQTPHTGDVSHVPAPA